ASKPIYRVKAGDAAGHTAVIVPSTRPPSTRPASTGGTAVPRPRAALSGESAWAFPYDASSWYQPETEGWFPVPYSPDHEINIYRDRMVGRVRDLTRNDGWATGAVLSTVD